MDEHNLYSAYEIRIAVKQQKINISVYVCVCIRVSVCYAIKMLLRFFQTHFALYEYTWKVLLER